MISILRNYTKLKSMINFQWNIIFTIRYDILQYINSDSTFMLMLSCVWLFGTPWTVVHQAPLSMEFSRQEYWIGLPFPTPGESFQPRDRTHVSCVSCNGRQILYTVLLGEPWVNITSVINDINTGISKTLNNLQGSCEPWKQILLR